MVVDSLSAELPPPISVDVSKTQPPACIPKSDHVTNISPQVSWCFRLREGFLATLLVLALLGVSTQATPVSTIHSPDGDIIDCVNKMEQPALKNPLLKNHLIQETPSDIAMSNGRIDWQIWHSSGMHCPDGTVAIRRSDDAVVYRKQPPALDAGARANEGHQHANAFTERYPIYGAKARLNLWDPVVENAGDFSLAQIWVVSGEYETYDLNTVEAGWHVYPGRYSDNKPRLFTYWTKDAYLTTGCYGGDIGCGDFILASSQIALGAAINQTSKSGGDQVDIPIQIWKDRLSGNWWVGVGPNLVPVGYWPGEIFTTLSHHATAAQWGGEVYHMSSNPTKILQMGSGKWSDKGFQKAAYVCNLEIAVENGSFIPAHDVSARSTDPDNYSVKKAQNRACGAHFYFGGPGPVRSASVSGATFPLSILLILLLLVV